MVINFAKQSTQRIGSSEHKSGRRFDLEIMQNMTFPLWTNWFTYAKIIYFIAKSGIEPDQVIELYRHIIENCKHLSVNGLMTIGKFGYDYSLGPNPDFLCLLDCHKNVCNAFDLSPENVAISMGMSDDFEQAVSFNLFSIYYSKNRVSQGLLYMVHSFNIKV